MDNDLTCGGLIFYNNKLLICRPSWNEDRWDLPKGRPKDGETPLQTAIREVHEETNIEIPANCIIINHGEVKYRRKRNIHLFTFILSVNPGEIKCNSFFDRDGEQIPEMVDYKWICPQKCQEYFTDNLYGSIIRSKIHFDIKGIE